MTKQKSKRKGKNGLVISKTYLFKMQHEPRANAWVNVMGTLSGHP